MAATSRMMRVTSCRASHTNCTKVFGFFGGMTFCPNSVFLLSMSSEFPSNPAGVNKKASGTRPSNVLNHQEGLNLSKQPLQTQMQGKKTSIKSKFLMNLQLKASSTPNLSSLSRRHDFCTSTSGGKESKTGNTGNIPLCSGSRLVSSVER